MMIVSKRKVHGHNQGQHLWFWCYEARGRRMFGEKGTQPSGSKLSTQINASDLVFQKGRVHQQGFNQAFCLSLLVLKLLLGLTELKEASLVGCITSQHSWLDGWCGSGEYFWMKIFNFLTQNCSCRAGSNFVHSRSLVLKLGD